MYNSNSSFSYYLPCFLVGNAVTNTTGKKSKKEQPVSGFVNLIDTEDSTLMELATAGKKLPLFI